jgi:hypothetical protein
MMYYYWKNGRIRPSVFYSMPKGELTVLQAFFEKEVAEHNELVKFTEGKGVLPVAVIN